MKLNGRVDTILGSTYWENGRLLSIHTNAITLNPIYYNEKKFTEQQLQDIKRMNLYKFVALYLFKHDTFDVREVGENKNEI